MTAAKAEAAAGLAIPRVIRKHHAGAGNAQTMGTGAGTTTATQIAAPPAAAGMMITATRAEAAAGLATPKVIRKRLAGAGRTDIDPNAATMRMEPVEVAPARIESESRNRPRDDDDRRGEGGRSRHSEDDDNRRFVVRTGPWRVVGRPRGPRRGFTPWVGKPPLRLRLSNPSYLTSCGEIQGWSVLKESHHAFTQS